MELSSLPLYHQQQHDNSPIVSLDPDWEVHLSSIDNESKTRRDERALQERMDDIRDLKRLFEEQCRIISYFHKQPSNNGSPTGQVDSDDGESKDNAKQIRIVSGSDSDDDADTETLSSNSIKVIGTTTIARQSKIHSDEMTSTPPKTVDKPTMTPSKTDTNAQSIEVPMKASPKSIFDFNFENETVDEAALFFGLNDSSRIDECDNESFKFDLGNGTTTESKEIQEAVNEIQELASRTNLVLALTQIQSLQSDIASLSKRLESKSSEVEDLNQRLDSSQQEIASISLERDLYQADAYKTKKDLQTCVNRMFDIAPTTSSMAVNTGSINDIDNGKSSPTDTISDSKKREKYLSLLSNDGGRRSTATVLFPKSKIDARKLETKRYLEGPKEKLETTNRLGSKASSSLLQNKKTFLTRTANPKYLANNRLSDKHATYNMKKLSTNVSKGDDKLAKNLNMSTFKPDTQDDSRASSSVYGRQQDKNLSSVFRLQRPSSLSLQHRRSLESSYSSKVDPFDPCPYYEKESSSINKMCCLFRKRGKGQKQKQPLLQHRLSLPSQSSVSSSSAAYHHYHQQQHSRDDEEDVKTMKRDIHALRKQIKVSMDTSDILRKRIVMINKFYESIIGELQQNTSQLKVAKQQLEVELTSQLSNVEKESRDTITKLRSALHERDKEIAAISTHKNVFNNPEAIQTSEV